MSCVGSIHVGTTMHFLACSRRPASTSAAIMCGASREMSDSLAKMMPRSSAQALTSPRWISRNSRPRAMMM
eukprot:9225594-Pyramimonas_sp.AAC.1